MLFAVLTVLLMIVVAIAGVGLQRLHEQQDKDRASLSLQLHVARAEMLSSLRPLKGELATADQRLDGIDLVQVALYHQLQQVRYSFANLAGSQEYILLSLYCEGALEPVSWAKATYDNVACPGYWERKAGLEALTPATGD